MKADKLKSQRITFRLVGHETIKNQYIKLNIVENSLSTIIRNNNTNKLIQILHFIQIFLSKNLFNTSVTNHV